jgi:molecular chaperone DnaK (HSP70)
MLLQTIDYGIYLGTTCRQIGLSNGTDVEMFKNNEGRQSTPSAGAALFAATILPGWRRILDQTG